MIIACVVLLALGTTAAAVPSVLSAGCQMRLDASGTSIGNVTITDSFSYRIVRVRIAADKNLLRAGEHGFHIHQLGVSATRTNPFDCVSTGAHYNPDNRQHGAPTDPFYRRHVGDLGNVKADQNGVIEAVLSDSLIEINGDTNNVVGRSFVLHEDRDDLGRGHFMDSKTTGHAGARLACCTIGVLEDRSWS